MLTGSTSREAIRRAIHEAGMTQESVAATLGITPVTISRWVTGVHDPGFDELDALAAAVGQPLVLVFGTTKEPRPEWAGEMEERLTELLMTNRETFVQRLAEQNARYGVEQTLAEPPPAEPAPDKQGPKRERAARR